MLNFVSQLLLSPMLFLGQGSCVTSQFVAPTAFHLIHVGALSAQVEHLLGPAPHGSISFALGWNDRIGWYGIIEKEGRWESAFGTVTVRCVQDSVVEKTFTPNALGIEAIHKIRAGLLGMQNAILRFRLMRIDGKY